MDTQGEKGLKAPNLEGKSWETKVFHFFKIQRVNISPAMQGYGQGSLTVYFAIVRCMFWGRTAAATLFS